MRLSDAVYAEPNKVRWVDKLSTMNNVIVIQSPRMDGVGIYVQKVVSPVPDKSVDELRKEILDELKKNRLRFWFHICRSVRTGSHNSGRRFVLMRK